jgi:hypothetical protein
MKNAPDHSVCPTAGHFYLPGVLATLEEAAAVLQIDPFELRCHCDREAVVCGTIAAVRLPAGVMAFRTRGTWRFRFPIRRPAPSGPDDLRVPLTGRWP